MNANLNLIGKQVNGIYSALVHLNCKENEIIKNHSIKTVFGFTFDLYIYTTKENKDFCYSVVCTNLESNQYETI